MPVAPEPGARLALDGPPAASLVARIAAVVFAASGMPVGPASAQGYGMPYTPPWQSGARSDRRPLDGSYRTRQLTQPVRHAPPAPIWQGLYVGGHGGFAFGHLTDRDLDEAVRLQGAAVGLHAGYNAQLGNLVIGLEADGTWGNVDGRRTFDGASTGGGHQDWHSSLRLRAGYAFGNVLVYGTAGAAFAGLDVAVTDALGTSRASEILLGWAAGFGVEAKLLPNVSGRIEALHYGFGDKSLAFPMGSVPVDLDTTVIRAGLTFHFH